MITLFLTLGILAFFFVALSLRLLLIKGGEFRGTCASQSPFLNKEGETCGYCGKVVDECPNEPSERTPTALPQIQKS
ncbi:MAG: hypothetical protein ACFB0B_08460 [Thermonemataceae bacterium]